jgi:hypothetical protein
MTKNKKIDQPSPVTPYQPTQEERTAVHAFFDRRKQKAPSPPLKVSRKGDLANVAIDHPEPVTGQFLLMRALGITDRIFSWDFSPNLLMRVQKVVRRMNLDSTSCSR